MQVAVQAAVDACMSYIQGLNTGCTDAVGDIQNAESVCWYLLQNHAGTEPSVQDGLGGGGGGGGRGGCVKARQCECEEAGRGTLLRVEDAETQRVPKYCAASSRPFFSRQLAPGVSLAVKRQNHTPPPPCLPFLPGPIPSSPRSLAAFFRFSSFFSGSALSLLSMPAGLGTTRGLPCPETRHFHAVSVPRSASASCPRLVPDSSVFVFCPSVCLSSRLPVSLPACLPAAVSVSASTQPRIVLPLAVGLSRTCPVQRDSSYRQHAFATQRDWPAAEHIVKRAKAGVDERQWHIVENARQRALSARALSCMPASPSLCLSDPSCSGNSSLAPKPQPDS